MGVPGEGVAGQNGVVALRVELTVGLVLDGDRPQRLAPFQLQRVLGTKQFHLPGRDHAHRLGS